MLLFSWEMPLADKVIAQSVIQVSLVEKAEQEAPLLEAVKPFSKPREEPKVLKKAPAPSPGKKEEKKEISGEVVKAEKIEREEKMQSGEKTQGGNTDPYPAPPTQMASAFAENMETKPETGPSGEAKNSGLSGGVGAIFANSLQQDSDNGGISLRGGEKQSNLPAGDGGKSEIKPSSRNLQESDPVLLQIMRKIEAAKRYPKAARKMGIEGKTVIRFKLKPGGQVEAVEIVETSGSDILDKASLETVREAAPLPYKEGWLKVGIVFKIL